MHPDRENRRMCRLLAITVAALIAINCHRDVTGAPSTPTLRVSLAFPPLGEAMATEFRGALPQFKIESVQTAALTVDAIAKNLVDWGVERADVAYSGHAAQQLTTPLDQQVRGIALLQPLPIHLLARPKSGIHTLADLRGTTIATGPVNTSSYVLAQLIVESAGITDVTLKPINSRATASDGLLAGTLDAAFFPGYVYPDDAVYAAVKQGAYLLPIDGPVVDVVRQRNPFVRVITIPRNIYPGQDRLMPTIGIEMVVICRQGLSDDIVHAATKQLFEVYPRLASVEASLRFLNLDNAPATPIPLHPGASRYYRELQLSQ